MSDEYDFTKKWFVFKNTSDIDNCALCYFCNNKSFNKKAHQHLFHCKDFKFKERHNPYRIRANACPIHFFKILYYHKCRIEHDTRTLFVTNLYNICA